MAFCHGGVFGEAFVPLGAALCCTVLDKATLCAACDRTPCNLTRQQVALLCTANHGKVQHSTAQHSTAQHSTAQHSTAQHSTAQHSLICTTIALQVTVLSAAVVMWYFHVGLIMIGVRSITAQ